MKALFCFALVLALHGATSFAQGPVTKIEGFLDIPWGATEDIARKTLTARAHARFAPATSQPGKLWFTGGKLAGLKARSFNLEFVSGQFWLATVILEPLSKDHSKEYASMRQLLTEKYGPPHSEDVRGEEQVANWYVGEGPQEKERIELDTGTRGEGLRVMYASDRLRKSLRAAQAPLPAAGAKPGKPVSTAPGAKDDL